MGIKWYQRLIESPEDKTKREVDERVQQVASLKETPEFRTAMIEAFNDLKAKEMAAEETEKREYAAKVQQAKLDVELVGKTMQDSPEPFANVLAMGFTKENGIKVKIDFNPAFIRFLNKVGITAVNDDETVRIWLAHLADDISRDELAEDYLLNGVSDDVLPTMGYEEMFEMDSKENSEIDENDNN